MPDAESPSCQTLIKQQPWQPVPAPPPPPPDWLTMASNNAWCCLPILSNSIQQQPWSTSTRTPPPPPPSKYTHTHRLTTASNNTWCWLHILSNLLIQQQPWSASTSPPPPPPPQYIHRDWPWPLTTPDADCPSCQTHRYSSSLGPPVPDTPPPPPPPQYTHRLTMASNNTWCWLPILSNSLIQQQPWSTSREPTNPPLPPSNYTHTHTETNHGL